MLLKLRCSFLLKTFNGYKKYRDCYFILITPVYVYVYVYISGYIGFVVLFYQYFYI